jgi:hypothetical protein
MALTGRERRLKNFAGGVLARPRLCFFYFALLLIPVLGGCADIRFSQTVPEAKDFHPKTVAVISIDPGGYGDVGDAVDGIVADRLAATDYFSSVVSARKFQALLQGNEDLRKTAADYLVKLDKVSFSDPDLSRKIGKLTGINAFLIVNVDYWYYTKEGDKDFAKVGLGMKMINADTGMVIWRGRHHLALDYVFLKPELSSVARDVVKQMIGCMPH